MQDECVVCRRKMEKIDQISWCAKTYQFSKPPPITLWHLCRTFHKKSIFVSKQKSAHQHIWNVSKLVKETLRSTGSREAARTSIRTWDGFTSSGSSTSWTDTPWDSQDALFQNIWLLYNLLKYFTPWDSQDALQLKEYLALPQIFKRNIFNKKLSGSDFSQDQTLQRNQIGFTLCLE